MPAKLMENIEPGHHRKQDARGQLAHQHADGTFHRTQGPPHPRKNDIAVADCRITGGREVKGRFP